MGEPQLIYKSSKRQDMTPFSTPFSSASHSKYAPAYFSLVRFFWASKRNECLAASD